MRRKQPNTPQRRSEPRENEAVGSGQPSTSGFSAFTPAGEDRPSPGPAPQILSGPGNPGSPGAAPKGKDSGKNGAGKGPQGPRPTTPSAAKTTEELRQSSGKYDFLAPRNWRVPTRLVAILLIPVVIGLVFGGLRVNSSIDEFTTADHAVKTAELARTATELADALQSERDLTLIPLMTGRDDQGVVPKLRAKTDKALVAYNNAFKKVSGDATLARRNDAFQQQVVFLQHLRDNAYKPQLFATATQAAYSTLYAPLLAFDNSVGYGSTDVTSKGRSIYALSLAKASASSQRAIMLTVLTGVGTRTVTRFENQELIQSLLVAGKLEQTALNEFTTGSTPQDAAVYSNAQVAQSAEDARSTLRMPDNSIPTMQGLMNIGASYSDAAIAGWTNGEAAANHNFQSAAKEGLTPDNWMQATSSHLNPLRSAEKTLLDEVVTNTQDIRDNAQLDAIVNSAIVVAALALAGLLTGFIARSMILGMRVLNTAALDIANHRLPDLVEKLSKTDPERVDTNVERIPLWGKDEIGEVARAFDQVHQQAVSLAAEQALLRGNVNAIFTNLSRRSQGLIQRQLALITDLENNEADPDQLENLFKLDHLATRMRRNGENLLVLAGEEAGRRWNTPVPLVDVLRAAASEVEQYERVELSGIPEAEVVGAAVTDLVHLLAELLENATTFSSPQTRVLVNATGLPDGRVLVEIHDKGIGLTAEDFAEINEKLAEPPTVDATISRRMGLFVVGRLSQRHDIRVQLRPSGESAGTTSLVMLPPFLTQMRRAPEPEEQFTVSRIFEQEPQEPQEPQEAAWEVSESQRSAAELGFDDHLTGNSGSSGFSPALEAMQRSQRLDQQRRRAALDAAPEAIEAEEIVEAEVEEVPPAPAEPYGQPYAEEGYQYGQDQYQAYGQHDPQEPYGRPQYADDYGYQQPGQGYTEPQYQDQPYGREQYQPQAYAEDRYADGYGYDEGGYGRTGQQFEQNQPFGGRADEPAGHPYSPEPYAAEQPALPPAAPHSADPGSGLPQRLPGQQLGGGFGSTRDVGGGHGGPSVFGGETPNWFTGAKDTGSPGDENRGHEVSALGGYGPTGPTNSPNAPWQSPNDGDWARAEQLREPAAGGTTPSGLPRRVPKQNLVPGNAKATPQDGPQVSRSPEEVRGRLTNLRRGVEQGRSASGDGSTGSFRIDPDRGDSGNGQQSSTDLFGGSNHQER
ncbi:nitrate- and nitrite sensing domain-containing protein [Kitasatospora sp. HPMI-4]|uniref:sensor histidine kinase n=1 Tax=Kitasatospora sp. HPMI-4 TaxID=3448443 RepID=UPI003F1BACEF